MYKKKRGFLMLGLVVTMALVACNSPVNGPELVIDAMDDTVPSGTLKGGSSASAAAEAAQAFIHENVIANAGSLGDWNDSTRIYDCKPVYLDGAEGISYYECAAETSGSPAGYVLVNMDGSDIPIPEFATSGTALYAQVKAAIPNNANFQLYRYGYAGIRAIAGDTESLSDSRGMQDSGQAVLFELGAPDLSQQIKSWRDYVKSEGTVPYYSRAIMTQLRSQADAIASRALPAAESTLDRAAALRFKYADGNYTASYTQDLWSGSELPQPAGCLPLEATRQYPVGCGATAWGIVYAYWKAFKGKSGLFPGVTMNRNAGYQPRIYSTAVEMKKMAQHMGTWWGVQDGNGFGLTWESDISKGSNYAKSLGYSCSAPFVNSRLNAWNMFEQVYTGIANDRPCILAIATNKGEGSIGLVPTHYVVVEEARKTNYRTSFAGLFWWPWANGSVTFKINMGWGRQDSQGHRYINIIDSDPAYTAPGALTSAFDMWDVRM